MPILKPLFRIRLMQVALPLILAILAYPSRAQSLGTPDNPALLSSGRSQAPLVLIINGPGRVFPFQDGKLLEIGSEYRMHAIPERGAVFVGWNQVNVFTFNIVTYDALGNVTNVTSTDISPTPISVRNPTLRFAAQPMTVLEDIPGFLSITQTTGWQANFVRR